MVICISVNTIANVCPTIGCTVENTVLMRTKEGLLFLAFKRTKFATGRARNEITPQGRVAFAKWQMLHRIIKVLNIFFSENVVLYRAVIDSRSTAYQDTKSTSHVRRTYASIYSLYSSIRSSYSLYTDVLRFYNLET